MMHCTKQLLINANFFNVMKKIILFTSMLSIQAKAQLVISHQLIGSTGNYSTGGGIALSSSTGEVAVETFFSSSHYLTQGFQQPGSKGISFVINTLNSACIDANNGFAEVQVKTGYAPFQYIWEPNGESTSKITNLKPGKYVVQVTDARGLSLRDSIEILLDFDGACGLHIYNGITPNGDNHNDKWIIDGIEEFPVNEVIIYNRWGDKVWGKKNYNNSDVLWDGNNMDDEQLPDGTYFYLVTINTKKYKGWVELTH